MKIRLIALALLLVTLFGVFGCTAGGKTSPEEVIVDETPNFIGGKSDALSNEAAQRPENLMNFAATDDKGAPLFQIVYKFGAGDWLKEECANLATAIYEVTGVTVPVVHSMEKQRQYEILVGDVPRVEVIDIRDRFSLKENDCLIKVVDTRVMIFSRNETALISGLMHLTTSLAYRNTESKEFGIAADMELLQQTVGDSETAVLSADEYYVELKIPNSIMLSTFARLSYTGNNGWRIQSKFKETDEYNNVGASQRLAFSLGETDPSRLEKIETQTNGDKFVAKAANGSRVEINLKEFRMDFYTPSNKLASTVTSIVTHRQEVSISGLLEEGEAVFGTGERFDTSNQRGNKIDMFTKDIWSRADACYMVIPLLCLSRGSGIFVNLYEQMSMELGIANAPDVWKAKLEDQVPLDVYIFTTEKIAEVIQCYSDLSGYAEMPEEWTYGMIVCAYSPDFSAKWTANIKPSSDGRGEGVYELIANMEKYDLPWTGVLAEGWPYRTSSSNHYDLKELCDYVHSFGKKFLVYTGVAYGATEMCADKSLATREVGGFYSSYYLYQLQEDGTKTYQLPQTTANNNNPDNTGRTRTYIDITNPEAVEWYFNEFWEYLSDDIGVDGCKIDFCELIPENQDLLFYDESTPDNGAHHWFPTAFCSMFWEMISSKPDSGMCYSRGGGIGSQRAPYMWAGDQARGYQSLRLQLAAILSSGLSGVPFMSYDMSGYQYGNFSKDLAYESQVFIRGTQFTAFTLCMQTHGKVRRSYQFANEDPAYLYVTEIYRAYVKLHEHLTPYITELSEEACTTGMPVMRHLVFGWQNDKNVYDIDDEYTFGDAFLIAPITNYGEKRNVYLPEGEWLDLNTGTEYSVEAEGMLIEEYTATLAELPTFYNKNTGSEIAPTLVDGIMELYDYARSRLTQTEE